MTNPQPEPSMEEILASIRRIISEDDEEGGAENKAQEAPGPRVIEPASVEPVAEEISQATVDEDASVSDPVEDQAETHLVTEDVEMIKKNVAHAIVEEDSQIVEETTAAAASSAFKSLSQSVRISEGPGKTLEGIVTEMLRPMVKEWLDANLPGIVEEKVEDEVQRVARRRN